MCPPAPLLLLLWEEGSSALGPTGARAAERSHLNGPWCFLRPQRGWVCGLFLHSKGHGTAQTPLWGVGGGQGAAAPTSPSGAPGHGVSPRGGQHTVGLAVPPDDLLDLRASRASCAQFTHPSAATVRVLISPKEPKIALRSRNYEGETSASAHTV